MPAVSVIVPAHNAGATIGRTLDALAAQDVESDFEVVVVDDGSTDDTGTVAGRQEVRVVRHANARGAAAARNSGVEAARGEVLAFTDADCEPLPNWLAQGLRELDGADLVQGRVVPPPGQPMGPFDRTLFVTHETGMHETANLFVRREIFERAGGFRDFLHGGEGDGGPFRGVLPRIGEAPFGEDAWFGWRARRSGARFAYSDAVVVHHAIFPRGFGGLMRDRWRRRHFPALLREVPEMRAAFYGRVFATRRTAAFDLAVGGVAMGLITRRWTPGLAALPYLGYVARHWGPSHRRALGEILGDGVGLVALAYGSATARVPLL